MKLLLKLCFMEIWIKRSAYMHTKQCNIMTYANQSNEGTNHMVMITLQIRKAEQVTFYQI